jgi:hypothetical protein
MAFIYVFKAILSVGIKYKIIWKVFNLPGFDITKSSLEKILLFLLLGCCRFWQIYSSAHSPSDSVSGHDAKPIRENWRI